MTMLVRLVKTVVVAGLAAAVLQSLPDIARYLKMREM